MLNHMKTTQSFSKKIVGSCVGSRNKLKSPLSSKSTFPKIKKVQSKLPYQETKSHCKNLFSESTPLGTNLNKNLKTHRKNLKSAPKVCPSHMIASRSQFFIGPDKSVVHDNRASIPYVNIKQVEITDSMSDFDVDL